MPLPVMCFWGMEAMEKRVRGADTCCKVFLRHGGCEKGSSGCSHCVNCVLRAWGRWKRGLEVL